ncbi:MAG: hypothetical protein RQ748_10390 [Elusimicrobiales bacterium]|nr:hypothetical protein [Elusimicrobiales bacterium]
MPANAGYPPGDDGYSGPAEFPAPDVNALIRRVAASEDACLADLETALESAVPPGPRLPGSLRNDHFSWHSAYTPYAAAVMAAALDSCGKGRYPFAKLLAERSLLRVGISLDRGALSRRVKAAAPPPPDTAPGSYSARAPSPEPAGEKDGGFDPVDAALFLEVDWSALEDPQIMSRYLGRYFECLSWEKGGTPCEPLAGLPCAQEDVCPYSECVYRYRLHELLKLRASPDAERLCADHLGNATVQNPLAGMTPEVCVPLIGALRSGGPACAAVSGRLDGEWLANTPDFFQKCRAVFDPDLRRCRRLRAGIERETCFDSVGILAASSEGPGACGKSVLCRAVYGAGGCSALLEDIRSRYSLYSGEKGALCGSFCLR